MKTAVHFFPDTQFVDHAIDIYKDLKIYKNIFCCYNKKGKVKFIKSPDISLFSNNATIISFINSNADFLILYSLCLPYSVLLKLNRNIKIVWHTVGYDIYSDDSIIGRLDQKKLINMNLYCKLTRKYLSLNFLYITKKVIRYYILFAFRRNYYYNFLINNVSYISSVLPIEKKYFDKRLKAKYIDFRFISERDNFGNFDLQKTNKTNILLGNSATPENNHLDVLEYLHSLNLDNINIIMPLSYGDERYRDYLIRYIKHKKYRFEVECLTNFLDFKNYKEILQSCSFAIFGVLRQQAMGNIYNLLKIGTKIFLYSNSIVYKQLIENGYNVYPIEEISVHSLMTGLSKEEKENNKKLITNELNYSLLITKLINQYNSM